MNLPNILRAPVIACLFMVAVSLSQNVLAAPLAPGNHTVTLTHDARERSAIVHVPPAAAQRTALPVVLNFHGGGGPRANHQENSLMDRGADRGTFVVVYSNSTGGLGDCLL